MQYLTLKQFIIKGKVFYKDKILTDEVSQDIIKRLVAKGFIKNIGEVSVDYEEIPFCEEMEEFLTPREINTLTKPKLIEYAAHIGATIDHTLPNAAIKSAINEFIEEALKEQEDDEGEDDDDKDNESENSEE